MENELKVYSVPQSISKAFNLYFSNIFIVVSITFIFLSPVFIFYIHDYFKILNFLNINDDVIYWTGFVLEIFIGAYLSVFLLIYLSNKMLDRDLSIVKAIKKIFPYFSKIFLQTALIWLIILLVSVPFIVLYIYFFPEDEDSFLILIFFPIIIIHVILVFYIFVKLTLTMPSLILEHKGVIESLKRSWYLTKDYFFKTFIIQFLTYGIPLIIIFVLYLISNIEGNLTFINILLDISLNIINPILECAIIIVFFNVKVKKERYNLEVLADEIGKS